MKQLVFGLICWAGVISVIVSIVSAASDEQGAIEGDPELLRVLAAAQSTGRSWFPRGALSATVSSSLNAKLLTIEADVTWDGGATYWAYRETEKRADGEVARTDGEMIETSQSLVCYWPGIKLAQLIRDKKRGYRKELRLRPDQIWFRMEDYLDWLELFDIGGAGAGSERAGNVVISSPSNETALEVEAIRVTPDDGVLSVTSEQRSSHQMLVRVNAQFTWTGGPKSWELAVICKRPVERTLRVKVSAHSHGSE